VSKELHRNDTQLTSEFGQKLDAPKNNFGTRQIRNFSLFFHNLTIWLRRVECESREIARREKCGFRVTPPNPKHLSDASLLRVDSRPDYGFSNEVDLGSAHFGNCAVSLRSIFLLFTAFCLFTVPAEAETGSFTFKRIKASKSGPGKLINIQVEPKAPIERTLSTHPEVPSIGFAPKSQAKTPPVGNDHAWFWAEISPALSEASLTRLQSASAALERQPSRAAALFPSDKRLGRIVEDYGRHILQATAGTQVSPALVLALISVESAGRKAAKSHAGAVGLMQLMPATARRFGVTDRTDPLDNISGGVKYLDFLLEEFRGDAVLALAGYNAGEGAVRRNGGVPNYSETRGYVPKVVAAWQKARLLCLQPPVRATDGCLFSGMRIASQ